MPYRVTYTLNINGVARTYTGYVDVVFGHPGLYFGIVIDDTRALVFNDSSTDQLLMKSDIEEFVNAFGIIINVYIG